MLSSSFNNSFRSAVIVTARQHFDFYPKILSFLLTAIDSNCKDLLHVEIYAEKIRIGKRIGLFGVAANKLLSRIDEIYALHLPPFRYDRSKNIINGRIGHTETQIVNELIAQIGSAKDRIADNPLYAVDAWVLDDLHRLFLSLADTQLCVESQRVNHFEKDLPSWPARHHSYKKLKAKTFSASNYDELFADQQQYLGFLYYVFADVEIAAMEVCSYMICREEMPAAFYIDLSRQIWDEARHAEFVYTEFKRLGGVDEKFGYTGVVIDRFLSGETLIERLIVQQFLQEGNAVEVNISLISALEKVGEKTVADSFQVINVDEALHTSIGNRWIKYISTEENLTTKDLTLIMNRMSQRSEIPLFGKGGWCDEIRQITGFPNWFIKLRNYMAQNA